MSWQMEFWSLVAERDEACAEERHARGREEPDVVTSAADRRLQAELALDKWRAKKRSR